jgi:chemotaxis protein CheD
MHMALPLRRKRETTLNPGEWLWGDARLRVKTLLGSCVAATFWHPKRHIGGICHYLLPERPPGIPAGELDGRYGTDALTLLSREVARAGTKPRDYVVKLFGGGVMFPRIEGRSIANVGAKNVAHGQRLLHELGYVISTESVTGSGYRTLHFDVGTGEVWVLFRGVGPGKEDHHD